VHSTGRCNTTTRYKAINALKQACGGTSIALDIAVLHAMFAFAMAQQMMA
jgi:hypothetical protein